LNNKNLNTIYINKKYAQEYFKHIQTNIINIKEQKLVKSLFPELSTKKCLEIGCAGAFYSREMLSKNAKQVDSIDSSKSMIQIAKKLTKNKVSYYHQDINFEFRLKDKYDFICASYVLHYSENISKTLINIIRLMNSKGILIFSIPNPKKFEEGYNQFYLGDNKIPTSFYNHTEKTYLNVLDTLGIVINIERNPDVFIVKFQKN